MILVSGNVPKSITGAVETAEKWKAAFERPKVEKADSWKSWTTKRRTFKMSKNKKLRLKDELFRRVCL